MEHVLNVAVIGAGQAGLVTARELQREGHLVTLFEKSTKVGGTWVYDPRVDSDQLGLDPNRDIIHSSIYKSLRVNSPRHLMGYLDYPFLKKSDGDSRDFPGHQEVARFLEEFAQDFGLHELIRFGHEVIRVEQVNNGLKNKWAVEWVDQEKMCKVEVFEAVVVCNGRYTEPKIADFSGRGDWPGTQMHCHNYRAPEPFHDQIVVIIGNGTSAYDISRDISHVAKEVHHVIKGQDVQFKKLDNMDNAWQHPMIASADEYGRLVFEDKRSLYANTIIHCTGYKFHFPFLRTNGIVTVDDNRVGPLYKHVFPPSLAPWLSFIGIPGRVPFSLVAELQSKWVAKTLSGKIILPTEEEMLSSVQEYYKHMEETGLPKHHTHSFRQQQFDYENWLAAQSGLPPLEKWREQMFLASLKTKIYGDEFRDNWDVDKWMQEYV